MATFIDVIVYGLSVIYKFSSIQQYFFSVSQGFHSSAKDQRSHLSSADLKYCTCAETVTCWLRDPAFAHCLFAKPPCMLYANTVSQRYWQSPAAGKYIKVVKENILHNKNSTESSKQTPPKFIKIKSCMQDFCFLNKRNQEITESRYIRKVS